MRGGKVPTLIDYSVGESSSNPRSMSLRTHLRALRPSNPSVSSALHPAVLERTGILPGDLRTTPDMLLQRRKPLFADSAHMASLVLRDLVALLERALQDGHRIARLIPQHGSLSTDGLRKGVDRVEEFLNVRSRSTHDGVEVEAKEFREGVGHAGTERVYGRVFHSLAFALDCVWDVGGDNRNGGDSVGDDAGCRGRGTDNEISAFGLRRPCQEATTTLALRWTLDFHWRSHGNGR